MHGAVRAYLLALPVRLLGAYLSRAFLQPDEYWQALEPAHRAAFGYGYETWEWRSDSEGAGAIRSPLYSLLFVPVYQLLARLELDHTVWLTLAPKILQGALGAACDAATYELARRVGSRQLATATLICSLCSFYHFAMLSRTFSNSIETVLTSIALACWPWSHDFQPTVSLAFASVAVIIRPSNAVVWLVLGLRLLRAFDGPQRVHLLLRTLIIGSAALALCLAVDTAFYGRLTFTPLAFIHQNVFRSLASFYGVNSLHFYNSQALPHLMLALWPFMAHGLTLMKTGALRQLVYVLCWTVGLYSLLEHKEVRFIHPLLPILHIATALSYLHLRHRRVMRRLFFTALIANAVAAYYFTAIHARGQVEVVDVLRASGDVRSVAFLMPCHSTPWQSHLHRRDLETKQGSGDGGRAWFITCEPPLFAKDAKSYKDQSDFFYHNPRAYLEARFPIVVDESFPPSPVAGRSQALTSLNDLAWRHEWPSHLVVFEALLDQEAGVKDLLADRGYSEYTRIWNSHWHPDGRRRGDILILRHSSLE